MARRVDRERLTTTRVTDTTKDDQDRTQRNTNGSKQPGGTMNRGRRTTEWRGANVACTATTTYEG